MSVAQLRRGTRGGNAMLFKSLFQELHNDRLSIQLRLVTAALVLAFLTSTVAAQNPNSAVLPIGSKP